MDLIARQFARRVLLVHLLLLVAVVVVVVAGAREAYHDERSVLISQAEERQELLAAETTRGLETFYGNILKNLDLLQKVEGETVTLPTTRRTREEGRAGLPTRDGVNRERAFAIRERVAENAAERRIIFGPFLWRQLEGRVSALMMVAPAQVHLFGSSEPNFDTESVAEKLRPMLRQIRQPVVTDVVPFLGDVNLACVPIPAPSGIANNGTLVAIIPAEQIEKRFLDDLANKKVHAAVVDHRGVVVASTDVKLAGLHLKDFRRVSTQPAEVHQPRSQVLETAQKHEGVVMQPSIVTTDGVNIPGRSWTLVIASPISDTDTILTSLGWHVIMWGGFIIAAVTGILISTSVFMIRNRVRLERQRHEMLTRELKDARAIQLAWLPGEMWSKEKIDIAAVNLPASHVSGDFYNWFELTDGRTVVLIGDVTGHGMSAAFLMATTQLLVRTTFQRETDPGKVMREVNRQLCIQSFNGQFVTMLICVIDSNLKKMEVAIAGHAPPIIDAISLDIEPQLVMGIDANEAYPTHVVELNGEEMIVLYTDGVQDAHSPNGTRFMTNGLLETVKSSDSASARELMDHVTESLKAHCGNAALVDDLTLVVVALKNGSRSSRVQPATVAPENSARLIP